MPTWEYKSNTGKTVRKIEGLGDVIERITDLTGIKSIVEKRAARKRKSCGCNKRREALNKAVPFKKGKS